MDAFAFWTTQANGDEPMNIGSKGLAGTGVISGNSLLPGEVVPVKVS